MAARELAGTWSRGTGRRPDRYCRRGRVLRLDRVPIGLAQEETASTLGASVCWDQGDEAQNGESQDSRTGKGDDDRDHALRGSDLVDPLNSKG